MIKPNQIFYLIIACFLVSACGKVERLTLVTSLFSGAEQYENFNRIDDIFPVNYLTPAEEILILEEGEPIELPESFNYLDQKINTQDFLVKTDTVALLILKDGRIAYEEYWLTGGKEQQWISMSVAKSFISALVGIAIEEDYISSIEDAVTKYVPSLIGSSYDGVRIKDILQMSSGSAWNEDYSDRNSDINRQGRIFALGGSYDEFAATLEKGFEPGTYNQYNSNDTQVLGMLIRDATGTSITDYMTRKLWHPMGAESESFWILDSDSMEMAFAGLNATARDYAKFGELYRLGGKLKGKQIVPNQWVKDSITPDGPHMMPGDNPLSDFPFGYGYQWWVPDLSGDFTALGVYNQMIYVSPASDMVIVKLSANSVYGTEAPSWDEFETITLFKEIIKH